MLLVEVSMLLVFSKHSVTVYNRSYFVLDSLFRVTGKLERQKEKLRHVCLRAQACFRRRGVFLAKSNYTLVQYILPPSTDTAIGDSIATSVNDVRRQLAE